MKRAGILNWPQIHHFLPYESLASFDSARFRRALLSSMAGLKERV